MQAVQKSQSNPPPTQPPMQQCPNGNHCILWRRAGCGGLLLGKGTMVPERGEVYLDLCELNSWRSSAWTCTTGSGLGTGLGFGRAPRLLNLPHFQTQSAHLCSLLHSPHTPSCLSHCITCSGIGAVMMRAGKCRPSCRCFQQCQSTLYEWQWLLYGTSGGEEPTMSGKFRNWLFTISNQGNASEENGTQFEYQLTSLLNSYFWSGRYKCWFSETKSHWIHWHLLQSRHA